MSVTIKEIVSKRDLKRFIKFPHHLYKGDPRYIPNLNADEMHCLGKLNPAFAHCEARYFMAYKDGKEAGRIAGIINYNANSDWNEKNIRFGWFDFIDDIEVSAALLERVADWGREKGMEKINGPWGFSDMDKEGMLVEGFENIQTITTLYNKPYYCRHMERLGFQKECDWVQHKIIVPQQLHPKVVQMERIIREKFGVSVIIPRKPKDIKRRAKEIFGVLNDSYVVLKEFTRLTEQQIDLYISQYMPFINKDLICVIVDSSDRVVGFAITMPSLTEGFQKAKGKLFPTGFIHILRSLKKYETVECYLIGVIPEYKNKGLNALIFNYIFTGLKKLGTKEILLNPQLENNLAVQKIFEYYDPICYARRRCYFSHISNQSKNDLCQ